MNPHTVYRKTAKGAEAISARAHGSVGRSRSLLILVDGKRSLDGLAALGAGFGDIAQMLAQLEHDGFIEAVASSGSTSPPISAPQAPAAALPPVSLAQAKSVATRRLMEILGPTSEQLCLRIESAQNMADFVAAVTRAYAVVRDIRGRAEADRFGAAVEANLPPPVDPGNTVQ